MRGDVLRQDLADEFRQRDPDLVYDLCYHRDSLKPDPPTCQSEESSDLRHPSDSLKHRIHPLYEHARSPDPRF